LISRKFLLTGRRKSRELLQRVMVMAGTALEYEQTIRSLPGVISARVINDADGEPSEIHVLASDARGARQVVYDIVAALSARHGLQVQPQQVSVALMRDDLDLIVGPARLRLKSVSFTTEGSQAEARVDLQYEDSYCQGVQRGVASKANKFRLVAEATLRALEDYFNGEYLFTVEDVCVLTLGKLEAVTVAVTFVGPQGEETYIGSSFLRNDDKEAVARATLNAVNRRFELLIAK